jgi:Arc/MetJ-type ribon-helix-helix transcriptional regulator
LEQVAVVVGREVPDRAMNTGLIPPKSQSWYHGRTKHKGSEAMTIKLPPEVERLINEELRAGRFRTAEEVVVEALQALRKKEHVTAATGNDKQRQAVREMLLFVEKNYTPLNGISIRELIHEGRRL